MYPLLHIFLVLVPGFLITTLTGIRHQQLLFSVGFSFASLIILVSLARGYSWTPESLVFGYLVVTLGLTGFLLLFRRSGLVLQLETMKLAWSDRSWIMGLLLVVTVFFGWILVTGPYAEVPADIYRHLEFVKYQYGFIDQGNLGPPLTLWQLTTQYGGFWYVLLSIAVFVSGQNVIDILAPAMLINGLLFVSAVYVFSDRLYRVLPLSQVQARAAAVLTCFFVTVQMGVSVFSYVRYYSLAPSILNFIVFFAAMISLMDLLHQGDGEDEGQSAGLFRGIGGQLKTALVLLLLFTTALVMHNQEGLFILVMVITTLIWLPFDRFLFITGAGMKRYLLGLGLVAVITVTAFGALVISFGEAAIPGSVTGRVVALPFAIQGFGPLHILNPYFQFAQVVTIWGGLVAVTFIIWFRFFRHQPILVAGMLSPLLTVFNPVFVDLYLRIEGDFSLWRLCFLIPLYAVAALVIVRIVQQWQSYKTGRKPVVAVIVLALLVIPLPLSQLQAINKHQRLSNLPVPSDNSYVLWQDLLERLNAMNDNQNILTDPVTGYVISALTSHQTFRYKFFASELYQRYSFVFDSYDNFPLSRYRNWLLVVNQRDGAVSNNGRISGHWPEDIMQVSKFYPASLMQHLQQYPDHFETVWQGAQITIYRIVR